MTSYRLLSWGANSHGQLGLGIESEQCQVPHEVDISSCALKVQTIRKIVGGAGHTLVLDDTGRVYSCGWNNRGQTGQPRSSDIINFQPVKGNLENEYVVDIACGWDHSAALTKEGALYVWGSNSFGQLGRDSTICRYSCEPINVAINQKINRVSMGLRHTAIISDHGTVLVTGAGSKGQLGLVDSRNKETFSNVHTFTAVSGLTNVRDIACGQYHTIAMTDNGEMYAFGENKHGQLGINPALCQKALSPVRLADIKFDSTAILNVGWTHNTVLQDGHVYTWGRNSYGQLGSEQIARGEYWVPKQITEIGKISGISVGSEHNVALTDSGNILCWGWNEHGNCGNGKVQDVFTPEQISIPAGSFGLLVGAGAGHSFAVAKIKA